jgi:hypothetical protein
MPTARHLRLAALTVVLLAFVVAGGLLAFTLAPRAQAGGDVPGPTPSSTAPAAEPGDAPDAEPVDVPQFVDPASIPVAESADVLAGVLPGDVPSALSGELVVAAGGTPAPGSGPPKTVRVEVERGLPIDHDAFATFVMSTLNDARGWGARGAVTFARTDGAADIRVVLASAATVDAMCAPLRTNGKWSCGRYGHAALNADRWVHGSDAFNEASGGHLLLYRQYLVNHEVGHLLGHQHTGCPAAGAVAPVMLQQSITLAGCVPNGWPYP